MADLGEELSRHRMRAAPVAGLFAATAVGAFCLALLHPVAAVAALIPLGLGVRLLVTRGRDRLTVHRDGFTLRHRGALRACRWGDVHGADIRLGTDRRPRIHAVTGPGGERITFAPFMGGLDALHHAYDTWAGRDAPAEPARGHDGIGALRSVHGPERGRGYVPALVVAGSLLLFALALLYFTLDVPHRHAKDVGTALGCTAAALGFVALLLWLALGDRGDELRVHEHGFAYRRRGVVQECRWDEIANFGRSRMLITSVMKDDGTWIRLSPNIAGVRQHVAPRVRIKPDTSAPPSSR